MPASSDRVGTEATCALFPPWEQDGVWGFRAPETIHSKSGLLYIDYDRSAPEPVMKVVGQPGWVADGEGIRFECELDRGVRFDVEIVPAEGEPDELVVRASLLNESHVDLSNLESQFCLVQNGVVGFEDPGAGRTLVLLEGTLVPLGHTRPGIPAGEAPAYIVSLLPGEEREPPRPDNSWRTERRAEAPLIVTVSEDGRHYVALAFENAYKLMTNCHIPCIHADPRLPDAARGQRVEVEGRVYFGEGPPEEVLERFYWDFPRWKPDGSH